MSFDTAFAATKGKEIGDSNDPADAGGATHDGITEAVARAHGYVGPMAAMPADLVKAIYKSDYWDAHGLDAVDALSAPIAATLFDTAVNGGAPVFWLQRSLNVLNNRQADYGDLPVTGHLGAMTVAALAALLRKRSALGETVILRMLNGFHTVYFVEDAEKRETDERFEFGWIANRIHMA